MGTKSVAKAIELVEERGDGDFEGPKESALINKAEQALGCSFPPSYKEFLLKLGCGDIGGFEVYGVVGEDFVNSGIPDAVWVTLKERSDAGLATQFVLIAEDGMGSYFALDTSQRRSDGECPVVLWDPGSGVGERAADDFGAFFLDGVRRTR